MKISHVATIVFVGDVPRSTAFYRDVLGQPVSEDHGTVVMFEHGFEIHDGVNLLEKTYTLIWGEYPIDRRGDFTYSRTVRDEIFFQKRNSDSAQPPAPTTDIRTK